MITLDDDRSSPYKVTHADACRSIDIALSYVAETRFAAASGHQRRTTMPFTVVDDGIADTAQRVIRAWMEMTAGYDIDPAEVLSTTFDEQHDELIVLRDIEFVSLCEHHLLPFVGVVHVGYIPGKVVGLSKLARLVDCFARRLQIQERMTNQIALALEEHLGAIGVGVIVEATHSCMAIRGVRKATAKMVTSSLRGVLREKPEARGEFLRLVS